MISLEALTELAKIIAAATTPEAVEKIDLTTARAVRLARNLDDPLFEGVATPTGRLRLEQDQQAIRAVSQAMLQFVGPALGVSQGFNALDGDGG